MLEGFVAITNIIEEVKLVTPREQRCTYAMYRCIAPPLWVHKSLVYFRAPIPSVQTHLVIETTLFIQIVKELGIGFLSPEVHIGYLKVTPDYSREVRNE
jgi:hypothetical protein